MPEERLPGQVQNLDPLNGLQPPADWGTIKDNTAPIAPPDMRNLLLGDDTFNNSKGAYHPFDLVLRDILNKPLTKGELLMTPIKTRLKDTERYSTDASGGFNPYDRNLEDWYGKNQSWLTQSGNRLGKFVVKTVGSFANSLMDIPNAISAIQSGSMDKFWDNPVNTWASDMMDWSERVMPSYQTNWESQHPFLNLIPFYGNFGNGWGKVFEQVGFTVGAIGGAVVEDLLVGAVTGGVGEIPLAAMQINKAVYKLGKMINAGEDALGALKTSIKSADDIVKGLKGVDKFNFAVRKGLWGSNMITSGFSEAGFEGIESYKTLTSDLKDDFFKQNGRNPNAEEMHEIDQNAREAANSRFLMNASLLAVTNSIQWGSLIRPFNVTKELIEAEAKQGVKIALKEGSVDLYEAVNTTSKLAKLGRNFAKIKPVSWAIGSASEGFEEGAQFVIQNGVDDYYTRKYKGDAIDDTNNFMKSFTLGLSKTLGTQEGWENIVYGLLGGAMYKGGEHIFYKSKGIDKNPNHEKQINNVIAGLNSQSLTGIFENKYGEAVATADIERDMNNAVKANNLFMYKNFKHEHFVNFVLSGLKQNKFETRMSQLQELKNLDNQEFAKTFGMAASDQNRKVADQYVNKLEENARYINDLHKRVSRTFINPFQYRGTGNKQKAQEQAKENENHIAYEGVKEQLIYTMSISKDSADRIAQLRDSIHTIADNGNVSSDTVVRLSSDEGLKELRTEYKTRLKDLEDSYKLAKTKPTKRDIDWHLGRIGQIDEILEQKDTKKQTETYNAFLGDVFDKWQEEADTANNGGKKRRKKSEFDKLKIADIMNLGRDISYLRQRNDIAIDRYAALTTKGGFKKLFDSITELRKATNDRPVNIVPEGQKENPQQVAAVDGVPIQQDEAALAAEANPTTHIPGLEGFEEVATFGLQDLTGDEKIKVNEGLQKILKGEYKPTEGELAFLQFKTIDDLKFDDPKVDLSKYTKVKATDGRNYYILNTAIEESKKFLAAIKNQAVLTKPVVTQEPANQPPVNNLPPKGQAPFRTEDYMGKIFVPTDLRPAFTTAIFSGTQDQIKKDLTVTTQALSPELQKAYDEQKAAKSYTPVQGFPGLFVSKAPIDLGISYKGTPIGKLAFPERLLFEVDKKLYTIDKISAEQYQTLTGRPASQHATDVEEFKRQVAFKNYTALKYKNNGYKPTTISAQEINSMLDIQVTYGQLDLVQADYQRPRYDQLKVNTVNLTDAKGKVVPTMAILSIPKRYNTDTASRERTEFHNVIYGHNYYELGLSDTKLQELINKSYDSILKVGSRYVGVVEQPDGTLRLIALRPKQMSEGVRNDLFTSLKDRAKLASDTNFQISTKEEADGVLIIGNEEVYYKLPSDEAKKFNDEFNTELNNQVFISDIQGKVWFDLSVSPIGAIRLEIHEPVTGFRETLYVAPQKVVSIKDIGGLIEAFNKEIEKKSKLDKQLSELGIKLSVANLRQNIENDDKLTAEDIAAETTAATTVEVFKNGTMRLQPNTGEVTKAYAAAGGTTTLNAKPENTPAPDLNAAPATTQAQAVQDAVKPVSTGIFGGLTPLPSDEAGDMQALDQLFNQEDVTAIEFPSVKDALQAVGVGYVVNADNTTQFFDIATGAVMNYPGLSPAELAVEMKLKVVKPTKGKTDDFNFKLAETGNKELVRMMNIEQAKANIYAILPSFIKVEDVNKILDKVSVDGEIWGAFQNGTIYLNQAAEQGTEYHEAFHAVYRMLLTDQEIDGYLDKAKSQLYTQLKAQGKSINDLLAERRALGLYSEMSNKQAQDRLYEEFMADRFMDYKNKQKSAGVFDKLFDLIRRFFKWMIRDRKDLDMLFRKIDTGQYQYANLASNRFTTEANDDYFPSEFAFSLIPARPGKMQVGKGDITIKRNLDAKTSKQVVQSVASYFISYRKLDKFNGASNEAILNGILDDLKAFHSAENPLYAGYSQEQLDQISASDESYIYQNEDSRETIKEAAKKYINSINFIETYEEEENEELEDSVGTPSTGYDNRSENKGGFSSLPSILRQYISFTSYPVYDEFNRPMELQSGVPVIATVDAISIYYGLMRSVANITDPVKFFQRMIRFTDNNEQSRKFVEKFIADTGLNVDLLMNEGKLEATKNKALVELVRKGFNKFRIDYLFTEHDVKKGMAKSYQANRKNVENVQFDKWSNNFMNGYAEYPENTQKEIRQQLNAVRNKYFEEKRNIKYTPEQLNDAINETQNALRRVGIQVSRDYIKFSILSTNAKKFDELAKAYEAEGAKLQFTDPANKFIEKTDYQYVQIMNIADEISLTRDFMDELVKSLSGNANPFHREIKTSTIVDEDTKQSVEVEDELDTAMVSRLLNVGKGNAQFDESVGESSYTSAENKIVYAHQDGTYNVKYSYKLRDTQYRKQLRETGVRDESSAYRDGYDAPILTQNFLLNSNAFEAVADNLIFNRIDGLRAVETNQYGRTITREFRDQKEGITYGHYSPREFLVNLMNLYVSYGKTQKTSKGDFVTAPHLIRVLEASKTADMVNLPINVDLFKSDALTAKAQSLIMDEVQKEFDRIKRVSGEISNLKSNLVENYHTGSFADDGYTINKGYRGLQFTDNVTNLLSPQMVKKLEGKARAGENMFAEDIRDAKVEINAAMIKNVNDAIDVMEKEGMIKESNGVYTNVLLHGDYFKGNQTMNLNPASSTVKFRENIGHVIINDYINTLSYNQILHGDSALSLKNDGGIDAVKRAKGDNAAIVSMRTDLTDASLGITKPFTHSNVAIFKEPVAADGTKIADAQMYTTVEGLRYTLWGLGRLTPRVATVLNALEGGYDIHNLVNDKGKTYDAIFDKNNGLLAWDEMTNSLKLVFKDGKTYFKMSVVILQPTLTSYINKKGQAVARPGWETLHNLRTKMEADGIHFAAPESASKMMTMDVAKSKDFSDLKGHLFDNTYFGLQTENPSNKLEITTPTQLLQLIDSEQSDDSVVLFDGKEITVGELKNAYQDLVTQRVNNNYDIAKQEMYEIEDFNEDIDKSITEGKVTPRLARFQQRAISTLESSGSDSQLLDFFSLDENGAPKYNLNMSATKVKFGQLYLNYFSKGILSQKSPGYTVALMSGIDTKIIKRVTRVFADGQIEWEVIRREQFDTNHENIQNERILGSKDQAKAVGDYFLAELEYNVPERDDNGDIIQGRYYSEMMLPPHAKEMLEIPRDQILPEAIAKAFGVRIPSQDKHSFMSFKLVDFLPANLGSTAMFPKDLIRLSGADFDIDKEYMSRYDYYTYRDSRGVIKFAKYGDAQTVEGKWEEYKDWMSKNNKTIKSLIKDIASKDPDYQQLVAGSRLYSEDVTSEIEDANLKRSMKEAMKNLFISQALKQMNLPSTQKEFEAASKKKELNNGVINNKLVDAYTALLTNKGMQSIANTPATLTSLQNIQNNTDITLRDAQGNVISSVFSKKTNYPVDSIVGKYYAFKNNTTGKDNIGIDVNANLIYSVLNKGKIAYRPIISDKSAEAFVFDGQTFNTFEGNFEFNLATGKFDGLRTNDILSTLITSATDEAKEQLNALYNLSVDALKVVNFMVGLKVPLKTAIYFVNQPSIRNYLDIKTIKQNTLQTAQEERLYRNMFKDEALARTEADIKLYEEMTNDELFEAMNKEGFIDIEC